MHNSNRHILPCRSALTLAAMFLAALSVSGCGSTNVMMAQKTIVYEDRIYNVSAVQEVRPVREIILPDGQTRDLARLNDRQVRDLFDDHDQLRVRFSVMFDERELAYARGTVDRAADVKRLRQRFDSAMERIRRFLAHRKQTQLQLS
jgi:hypothetical protein